MLHSGAPPPTLSRLTSVKTKCAASNQRLLELTSEASENFAVSPSTPLLSTSVSDNCYVCGKIRVFMSTCVLGLEIIDFLTRCPSGSNRSGQLGITGLVSLSEPQLIQGFVQGACRCWASLAFGGQHAAGLTGCGALYTWGTNSKGQVAHGQTGACVSVPERINITSSSGELQFKYVLLSSSIRLVV